jgi:thioredoxin-like negative regulator of GroEL
VALLVAALVLTTACSAPAGPSPRVPSAAAPTSSAAARAATTATVSTAVQSNLPPLRPSEEASIAFVDNDYPRALADARARRKPLFVDAWAPWCHTCLSMKSYVLPDPSLRRFASRFVWLSLDTERDDNAQVVSRLGVHVLPTLYVIDPATERVVLAWPGSLTAGELGSLLEDAELALSHGDSGGEAAAALLRGRQAAAAGRTDDAIEAYRAALAAATPDWPRRPMAVDALVTSLSDQKQVVACTTIGADEASRMPPGTPLADVLRVAMGCAEDLPKNAAERQRLGDLAVLGERLASDLSTPILADDRSDLYDYVVHALHEVGRGDEATRAARAWAGFLEAEAARSPTAAARAVFDAHRLLAYMALGEPQRAIPVLEQSERDFPDDYNPPARLAVAYKEMKRYDDALSAVRRALVRGYGPRKLRLFSLEADICEVKGDKAGARHALREAIDFARHEHLRESYAKLRESLEQRLERLR